MDPDPTHYRSLGLGRGATSLEIRNAYLNLAKLLHPDRYSDRPPAERRLAERRMREVNEAYRTLGDTQLRREYDRALAAADPSGSTAAASTQRSSRSGGAARTAPPDPSRAERFDADTRWRRDDGSIRYDGDVEDGILVSPAMAFLLRRGPTIALALLIAALFIGTAYAGQGRSSTTSRPTTTCAQAADEVPMTSASRAPTSVGVPFGATPC